MSDVKPVVWRCFHCDETFTDEKCAEEHFGKSQHQKPACQIDVAEYRRMEEMNRLHCAEDTELHHAIYRAIDQGNTKAIRAEEAGYAKGLGDYQKDTSALQAEIEALRQKVGTGRAIIVDLLDQIDSLQSYELTRDLEGYKAQAIWDSAIENAKRYAAIAKEKQP